MTHKRLPPTFEKALAYVSRTPGCKAFLQPDGTYLCEWAATKTLNALLRKGLLVATPFSTMPNVFRVSVPKPMPQPETPSFTTVLRTVSEFTGVSSDLILAKLRRQDVVDARVLVVGLLYDRGEKVTDIAMLTRREHSTISSTWRRHQALFETDKEYRRKYITLKETLYPQT